MLNQSQIDEIRPKLQLFRLVIGTLIAGVAIFAVVALVFTRPNFPPQLSAVSTVLLALSGILVVNGFVLPPLVDRATLTQIRSDHSQLATAAQQSAALPRLTAAWLNRSLVGAAILEGAALLNLVGMLLEGNAIHLAAAFVVVLLMVFYFPLETRVLSWIEARLELLNSD